MADFLQLLALPLPGAQCLSVWRRNWLYFKRSWMISALWVFVEPLLAAVAFGFGIGALVGQVEGRPYLQFFFPGLMASTSMMVAYFEATYGSYTKLTQSRIFNSIITTPVMPHDVAMGELLWAASKGLFSAAAVGVVGMAMGLFSPLAWLAMLLVAAMNSLVFGALGLLMSSFARNYDWFIYAQTGLIAPMALFCGTYFPLAYWPSLIQWLAWMLPLTHTVTAMRAFAYNLGDVSLLIHGVYLVGVAVVLINWSVRRISAKLVT